MKITGVCGHEIYTADGKPTFGCTISLQDGTDISAYASRGYDGAVLSHEADEVPYDNTVRQAVAYFNENIAAAFLGSYPHAMQTDTFLHERGAEREHHMHETLFSRALSMAMYRAHAYYHGIDVYEFVAHALEHTSVTLPYPFFTVFRGRMSNADNMIMARDICIAPAETASFAESCRVAHIIHHMLALFLRKHNVAHAYSLHGGYELYGISDEQALEILSEVLVRAKYHYDCTAVIVLNMDASRWYNSATQEYMLSSGRLMYEEVVQYYTDLCSAYPICLICDPVSEQDSAAWDHAYRHLGGTTQLASKSLFGTDTHQIEEAYNVGVPCTAAALSLQACATVTEFLQAVRSCHECSLVPLFLSCNADAGDTFCAELAVGAQAGYFHIGGCLHAEHTAHANHFIMREDVLAAQVV